MEQVRRQKLHKVWMKLGFLAVLVMLVPYMLLGQDAIFVYHDQLDGELIAYILQAKHLFDGSILPEFLNGADKTALTLPAPLFCLLFRLLSPFWALVIMQLVGSLTGYLGMYLLARENGSSDWVAMLVGVLYAYLPFLPVYGLTQYGIPLLLWWFCRCKKGESPLGAWLYAGMYALTSSLVLAGFGVLLLCLVWIGCEYVRMRKQKENPVGIRNMLGMWLLLLVIYLAENGGLIWQVLAGGEEALSHKVEYALQESPFWESFVQYLLYGGQHSEDGHLWILAGVSVIVLCCIAYFRMFESVLPSIRRDKAREEAAGERIRKIGGCLLLNMGLAAVAALWDWTPGISLRSQMQALGAFQLDRLLWMAPCFWYLMLALTISLLCGLFRKGKTGEGILLGILGTCLALVTVWTAKQVLLESNLKPNVQKLRNADYPAMSFRDYYAIGVLEQVEAYIEENCGQSKEAYKVVSLGIDPAAALYHGFSCLDGYSNNYSLEYKHAFREIIAGELDKSAYLQAYFDEWGNRCYVMSAECPAYYTIEKGGFFFQNLELNVDKLQSMGCTYLFSAAYIQNAEELGLTLLREEGFETPDSYYQIYLYKIT